MSAADPDRCLAFTTTLWPQQCVLDAGHDGPHRTAAEPLSQCRAIVPLEPAMIRPGGPWERCIRVSGHLGAHVPGGPRP